MVLPGSASVLRPGTATQLGPSTSGRDMPLPAGISGRAGGAGAGAAVASSSGFPPEPAGSGSAAASRGQKGVVPAGFTGKLDTMVRLCELASTVTAVDHPLCLDCAAQLKDEVQKQLEELDSEIAAYSDAVKRLEAQSPAAVPQVSMPWWMWWWWVSWFVWWSHNHDGGGERMQLESKSQRGAAGDKDTLTACCWQHQSPDLLPT